MEVEALLEFDDFISLQPKFHGLFPSLIKIISIQCKLEKYIVISRAQSGTDRPSREQCEGGMGGHYNSHSHQLKTLPS